MAKKQILVIEDEQIVAYDLRILLTRLGHIPLGPATSGPEAIEMAARTRPDLILMDVQLDGPMDGVEASVEIVKNRPVPIIYLTAYPGTFVRNPHSMVSPFLCAAKPFSAEGLEAIINRALGISTIRPN